MAGNPARIIRKIETKMDPSFDIKSSKLETEGAEVPMAQLAKELEKNE